MKLLCGLLGHKPEPWYTLSCHPLIGTPYYDGIFRAHRELTVKCARCDTKYVLGKVIDPILSKEEGERFFEEWRNRQ